MVVVFLAMGMALAICACATGSPSATPVAPTTGSSAVVPWTDADAHIGEMVTIEGPVVTGVYAESSSGEPTFLNVGRDYPDPGRFTVVIWGENRLSFPDAPESMYVGETVQVTGEVTEYEGIPEVSVSSPAMIKVEE
jgi:DNA/RNA endonuclease YhcR with UshA esterase domain